MGIYYKVTINGGNSCTIPHLHDVNSLLEEPEVGDKFTIEVVNMSKEDFEKLPEWDGP